MVHDELHISIDTIQDADDDVETVYEAITGKVIHPPDATVFDQMNLVERSGTLDFWNDPEENVYGERDGDDV